MATKTKGGIGGMIKKVPWWVWVGGLAVVWVFRAKLVSASLYPAAAASPEGDARAMYARLKNHPKLVNLAIYKQYWPAIDKLMAKGDFKNALVYLKWLGAKVV